MLKIGPRFSELNSFEHEYGTRWKQLHELHRQKEEALKKELAAEEEKLEAQMEYAKYVCFTLRFKIIIL